MTQKKKFERNIMTQKSMMVPFFASFESDICDIGHIFEISGKKWVLSEVLNVEVSTGDKPFCDGVYKMVLASDELE